MSSTKAPSDTPPLGVSSVSSGEAEPASQPLPSRIAGYCVKSELGRGGMARVYHVVEESSGRELALKQLRLASA